MSRAHTRETLASGLKQASAVLQMSPGMPATWNLPALSHAFEAVNDGGKVAGTAPAWPSRGIGTDGDEPGHGGRPEQATTCRKPAVEKPQETLLRELTRAADGRRPDRRRRLAGQP